MPLGGNENGFIKIDTVPSLLIKSLIAVEDRNFYAHYGIDFSALFRAIVTNLLKGRAAQGGSTITQQLARHLFFSRELSI